jgi:hypothetical protein
MQQRSNAMTKEEVLKAFERLSEEDQQAVRVTISKGAEASCCDGDEMKSQMESMMKMMQSSETPMEHCKQMMAMCQNMMQQKMQPT